MPPSEAVAKALEKANKRAARLAEAPPNQEPSAEASRLVGMHVHVSAALDKRE